MSAYTLTLADAQNDISLKQISGVVSTSDQFTALLNEAGESLAIRGGWFDLEQRIRFCLTGCEIIWPYFVGTVLGVRFCGGRALMQNQWYSFVNNSMGAYQNSAYGLAGGYGASYDGGYGGGSDSYRYGNGACVIEDDGTRPCYNEITGTTGKLIRYCVNKPGDIGKNITLFGKKFGGQPLQELVDGAWVNGLTITADRPYGVTSVLVTHIDAITREATEGTAQLYEYDVATSALRDLQMFQPYETNPRYRCSRIMNRPNGKLDDNGNCWTSVEALIKLKFIPAKHPRDFLPISNMRALKLAIQAITLEQNNDSINAQVKWTLAVQELNRLQDDLQPKKQIPVRVNLGRAIFSPI